MNRIVSRSGARYYLIAGLAILWAHATAARADLAGYLKKPDAAFSWKLKSKNVIPQGTVYDLHLISQKWQGITWEHQLQVYQPKGAKPTAAMFLWNQGGKASGGSTAFGMGMAQRIQAPVAFLYGIPNQPLLGGKREDTLIAETFVRYLKTKDGSWPLLFPMVKSLVKAMDALQEFGQKEWKFAIKHFIVSGASKRGWTTWLTGASDPRVKAIAPLVIDTLNMREQMSHQLKSFGKYSEQIRDYTLRGLVPVPKTAEARKLWSMVDPYLYRDRLTMPKMIINGNNDPYWTVDALNLYWDGLKGDKWVLYVPNAGHGLAQLKEDGKRDLTRALSGLAAFVRHSIKDNPMPRLSWKHDDANRKMRLRVQAKPAPKGARLWVSNSDTRDFRKATWKAQPATIDNNSIVGEVEPPAKGFRAFYAELDYEVDGIKYQLSTQLRVAKKK